MAKIQPLADVGSLANTTAARAVINDNSQKIENAFQNTLSRDGSAPNQMEADFDLNDHYLLNVADPVNEADGVNLRSVRPLVEKFASEIVETAVFGTQVVDPFVASAGQFQFLLSESPGNIENISVFVNGVARRPSIDFFISGPTLQTLTLATPLVGGETVSIRYAKALPSGITLSQAVTYTSPSTGISGTVKSFLDSLWTAGANTGAALVRFLQGGTSAVARTAQDKMSDIIDAKDFGVTANGVTDDTSAMVNAIARARAMARPLHLPAGTIKTSAALDISGVTLIGAGKDYRNASGTVIQGAGTHDVLVQSTAAAADTVIGLHNLRIKGGLCGVKVRYMLHSHWSNVHITDCADGIQFGNSSDAGGLFNTFDNIEVVVTGTALDVNGNGFVNANSFNQCYFSGDQYGGRIRCTGGIGAVDNVFNCCEFVGTRYGVELSNTKNTSFNECYFESLGPSILLAGGNLGWNADDCVFAGLLNTNLTGRNAFIYHVAGAVNRGSVKGGYIYIPSDTTHNNLSFFASEDNANFFLVVADEPDQEIAATGFVLYNNLNSANISITSTGTYTPTWTGSGGNPSLGNGTLTGRYARAGNVVTVTINLVMGGTTTFGSGVWSFGLPFAANAQWAGDAWMRDAGTAFFTGLFLVGGGQSAGSIYFNNSANNAGPTQPFTWVAGDELTISITYRC